MKTLIIARHGNTFRPGETPTRVGAHTDLPLVEEGRGRAIGRYLAQKGLQPSRVLAAPLKRTLETAALAVDEMGLSLPITPDARFLEVDYGPDENKTEDMVELRLGRSSCTAQGIDSTIMSSEELQAIGHAIIKEWNAQAIVPMDWKVDTAQIQHNWMELAASVEEDEILLCVSSNGTIRFSPCITGDCESFYKQHDIKLATGAVSIFTSQDGGQSWRCEVWGVKAYKLA